MWHLHDLVNEYPKTRLGVLVLLYCLPVFLIWYGIVPFSYRYTMAFLIFAIMLGYIYYKGHNIAELGLRTDNFIDAVRLYLPATVFVSSGLYLIYFAQLFESSGFVGDWFFYTFYFVFSCPLQEFMYRSVIFAELKDFKDIEYSRNFKIAFSTLAFSLVHLIYFDYLLLSLSIGMGVMWGYIYDKNPNLPAASIAHFIVGSLAFYLQLV